MLATITATAGTVQFLAFLAGLAAVIGLIAQLVQKANVWSAPVWTFIILLFTSAVLFFLAA